MSEEKNFSQAVAVWLHETELDLICQALTYYGKNHPNKRDKAKALRDFLEKERETAVK